MPLLLDIILLTFSFTISIVGLTFEYSNKKIEEKESPDLKQKQRGRIVYKALLYLNITVVIISIVSLVLKNMQENFDKQVQKDETNFFKKNDSISLHNDTVALTKLNMSIRQLDTTLLEQRLVAERTTKILYKNDSILRSQSSTNMQVDQIINPITELLLQIETEISFDEPEVKSLTDFIYTTKSKLVKDGIKYPDNFGYHTADGNIIGWTVSGDSIDNITIEDMLKVKDFDALNFYKMFYGSGFELSFIKYPIKRFSEFNNLKMRRMVFRAKEIISDQLSAHIPSRKFRRVETYRLQVWKPFLNGFTTLLGFNDLKESCMLFVPFSGSKCYLKKIVIQSLSGLKNSYEVNFKKSDRLEFQSKNENLNVTAEEYYKNYKYENEVMRIMNLKTLYLYFYKLSIYDERSSQPLSY